MPLENCNCSDTGALSPSRGSGAISLAAGLLSDCHSCCIESFMFKDIVSMSRISWGEVGLISRGVDVGAPQIKRRWRESGGVGYILFQLRYLSSSLAVGPVIFGEGHATTLATCDLLQLPWMRDFFKLSISPLMSQGPPIAFAFHPPIDIILIGLLLELGKCLGNSD